MKKVKMIVIMPVLIIALLAIVIAAACVGSANIPYLTAGKIIASDIPFLKDLVSLEDVPNKYITIVNNIRFPRIIVSGCVGMALALVGGAYQGILGNPLADPNILGVSSGAAAGATIAIVFGTSSGMLGLSFTSICAFIGALITVALVFFLSLRKGKTSDIRLLLTGTAMSSALSAFISLVMSLDKDNLERIYLWTLGSFSASNWSKVKFIVLFSSICSVVVLLFARELDIIAVGSDTAVTLGVATGKVKSVIILVSTMLVASAVSVSGIIGFVGLIVPHCVRMLFGASHRRLLPASMVLGAMFMIFCDSISRTIIAPTEVPVGVVTAVFGAPYFIFLLHKSGK
jgi:iron complex transport system permease protein